jgi:hypothetical protein
MDNNKTTMIQNLYNNSILYDLKLNVDALFRIPSFLLN